MTVCMTLIDYYNRYEQLSLPIKFCYLIFSFTSAARSSKTFTTIYVSAINLSLILLHFKIIISFVRFMCKTICSTDPMVILKSKRIGEGWRKISIFQFFYKLTCRFLIGKTIKHKNLICQFNQLVINLSTVHTLIITLLIIKFQVDL